MLPVSSNLELLNQNSRENLLESNVPAVRNLLQYIDLLALQIDKINSELGIKRETKLLTRMGRSTGTRPKTKS